MIPLGVVSEQIAEAGGGGGELPATAIARLNFQSGFYYAGGVEQAVTALLGGGFNVSQVSASGMHITNPGGGLLPWAIGDLFTDLTTALATGCTIVFDIDFVNPPFGTVLVFVDDVDYDAADNWVIVDIDNGVKAIYLETEGAIAFDGTTNELLTTGVHKIAVTLNRDLGGSVYQYASSVDGNIATTSTDTSPAFSPFTKIAIGDEGDGGRPMDNVYFRSITLYPAKTPTELALLSAP